MNQPYLSVVVTARNDDHGGNLLGRMQAFINGLVAQCVRFGLQAELIIVEWNPLPDRPPLADVLHWPEGTAPSDGGYCAVRIIEVPPALHQRLRNWQALPLYQMIGKNVGIRRAYGEYVLATNIDILFSNELMRYIAEKRLEKGKMYRVNRWDVMSDVPIDAPPDEQLAYCETHLIRLNAREGTFRLDADGLRTLEANDIATQSGSIKLGSGWFQRELSGDEPFRWVENDAEFIISPANHERVLMLDVEPGPGVNMNPFLLEFRDVSGKLLSEIRVKRRSMITFPLPKVQGEKLRVRLHTRDGGNRTRADLRTLNFRVFRCKVRAAPVGGSHATPPGPNGTAASVSVPETLGARVGRGLRIARELIRGNPNVQLRIPMSQEQLENLQLKQDGGGLSFSLRALRKRNRSPDLAGEVLPSGMRAVWGTGWYPLENFRGESFRWMEPNADVVWLPQTSQLPSELVLHFEPGPSVGFQPCQVEIRDQWGEILDVHEIRGRTAVPISVSHISGPFITSFRVIGGGPPKKLADTRTMALRFLGATWGGDYTGQTDTVGPELLSVGSGIWTRRGWCSFDTQQGSKGLAALRDAELILRVPDGPNRMLTLDVAPGPGHKGLDLLIEDSIGRILYRGEVAEHTKVHLKNIFEAGKFYALRLGDGKHEEDAPSGNPMLMIPAIQWNPAPGASDDLVRIVLHQTPVDQAVQLHTNACGDFTMIAKDHWMDLRSYPEMDVFSMNIDSVFCWVAHHGGAREEFLPDPMRIYHIEHGSGSGWTPEGEKLLFDRIAAKGLTWVDYPEVIAWARIMNRYDAPMIFNRDDWGMAGQELKETIPHPGSRPAESALGSRDVDQPISRAT